MTLCDTGSMVAIVSVEDKHHLRCLQALEKCSFPLTTTWPCLSEAMHLLYRYRGHFAQEKLWDYFENGVIKLPMQGLSLIHI